MGSTDVCVCACVTMIKEEEAICLEGDMGRVAGEEEDGNVFRYEVLEN